MVSHMSKNLLCIYSHQRLQQIPESSLRQALLEMLEDVRESEEFEVMEFRNKAELEKALSSSKVPSVLVIVEKEKSNKPSWSQLLFDPVLLSPNTQVIVILPQGARIDTSDVLEAGALACFVWPFEKEVLKGYIDFAAIRANRELFLSMFAEKVNNLGDVNKIATMILDELQQDIFLGFDRATFVLVGCSRHELLNPHRNLPPNRVLLENRGYGEQDINQYLLRPLDQDNLMKRIITSGKPYILNAIDAQDPPRDWEVTKETEDIRSWIGIPLMSGDRVVGIITLDSKDPDKYVTLDENILLRFATVCANSMDQTLGQRNRRIVQKIMAEISLTHDIVELLNKIIINIMIELRCSQISVFRRQEINGTSVLTPWANARGSNLTRTFREGEGLAGEVLRSKQSLIVPDVLSSKHYLRPIGEVKDTYSMMLVPIMVQDRLIAVISADRQGVTGFSRYDLELTELLAQQAATLIERTWALGLVFETSASLNNKELDIDRVLVEIVRSAVNITNSVSGIIFRINQETYEVDKAYGWPEAFNHPDPRPDGQTRTVIKTGEIALVSDKNAINPQLFGALKELIPDLNESDDILVVGVPLILEGNVMGVLHLNTVRRQYLNPVELHTLRLFANHAAAAISNADLLEATKRPRDSQMRLAKANAKIFESDDINSIFDSIVEQACELAGAGYSHLALKLRKDGRNVVEFRAAYPTNNLDHLRGLLQDIGTIDLETGSEKFPGRLGITGLAVKRGKRIRIQDIRAEPEDSETARHYIPYVADTQSELAQHIVDPDSKDVIGVINIEHQQKYAFTDDIVSAVEQLATQAAIAIQRNQRHKQETLRLEQLKRLSEISDKIMRLTPQQRNQVLTEIATQICPSLQLHSVLIVPLEEVSKVSKDDIISSSLEMRRFITPTERDSGVTSEIYYGSRSVYVTRDIRVVRDDFRLDELEGQIGGAVCLPLISSQGHRFGVIWYFFSEVLREDPKSEDLNMFKLYANLIALGYDNVMRAQERDDRISDLQEEIKSQNDELVKRIQRHYNTTEKRSKGYFRAGVFFGIAGIIIVFVMIIYAFVEKSYLIGGLGAMSGVVIQVINALLFSRANAEDDRLERFHNEILQIQFLNILFSHSEKLKVTDAETASKENILTAVTSAWFSQKK